MRIPNSDQVTWQPLDPAESGPDTGLKIKKIKKSDYVCPIKVFLGLDFQFLHLNLIFRHQTNALISIYLK